MLDSKTKLNKARELISNKLNYTFINTDLLLEAITHKSISKNNYERLEFLGDAVLQLVISKYLFDKFPHHQEGYLSREKQSIVSKNTISKLSLDLKLLDLLRSNNLDLASNNSLRESLSADLMESLIGAIFLDSNYLNCEKIIINIFRKYLNSIKVVGRKDPKTLLQEYMQSIGEPLPKYSTTKIGGSAHNPKFKISCSLSIYSLSESVIADTVQSGQQDVSQFFLNKIQDEKKI
jgi:ribonuclease-3